MEYLYTHILHLEIGVKPG